MHSATNPHRRGWKIGSRNIIHFFELISGSFAVIVKLTSRSLLCFAYYFYAIIFHM